MTPSTHTTATQTQQDRPGPLPRPRILIGAILHETNTFNLVPTRLKNFEARYLWQDPADIRRNMAGTATEISGFIAAADGYGWQAELTVAAACGPSGPLLATDWHHLRDRVLRAEGPFDGVLLALHGAMVTADETDPEGEFLQALRVRLGLDVPIIITLDMHANVSKRMVEAVDAMVPYETYPHVDHKECAIKAARILARLLGQPRTGARLTRTALVRPPMLDAADHGRTAPPGPMNGLIEQARHMRTEPDVLVAGLVIGFPWADVPEVGPAAFVTVIAGSRSDLAALAQKLAQTLAQTLAQGLWDSRAQTQLNFATPEMAMHEAQAGRASGGDGDGPLVLADIADNPAGGAHGDSPNLLRAMLAAGLENAVFATIADPEAVQVARKAGIGANVTLSLGGRQVPDLTPPLCITAQVEQLHNGRFCLAGPVLKGIGVDMGQIAVLRVDGIRVIVASRALAVTDVALFHALGIDPTALTTIALKSRNHHRAAFGALSRKVILVDAGGIATMRLDSITFDNLPRPIWPLDPLPDSVPFRLLETHVNA
jgi:microcystin degradation protein MlrC